MPAKSRANDGVWDEIDSAQLLRLCCYFARNLFGTSTYIYSYALRARSYAPTNIYAISVDGCACVRACVRCGREPMPFDSILYLFGHHIQPNSWNIWYSTDRVCVRCVRCRRPHIHHQMLRAHARLARTMGQEITSRGARRASIAGSSRARATSYIISFIFYYCYT